MLSARSEGSAEFPIGSNSVIFVAIAGFGEGANAVLDTRARALAVQIGANRALPAMLDRLPSDPRERVAYGKIHAVKIDLKAFS